MSTIVLLFIIGLILLGFEVFVPGAILGIFGGLILAAGCVIAFMQHGTDGGMVAVAVAVVLIGLLLYFEFRVLPRTKLGRRLFLHSAVTGRSPEVATPDVVGQAAQAVTVLAPTGYVVVNGRRYEAYSQSGYVASGANLRVVALDNFRLIVTHA